MSDLTPDENLILNSKLVAAYSWAIRTMNEDKQLDIYIIVYPRNSEKQYLRPISLSFNELKAMRQIICAYLLNKASKISEDTLRLFDEIIMGCESKLDATDYMDAPMDVEMQVVTRNRHYSKYNITYAMIIDIKRKEIIAIRDFVQKLRLIVFVTEKI